MNAFRVEPIDLDDPDNVARPPSWVTSGGFDSTDSTVGHRADTRRALGCRALLGSAEQAVTMSARDTAFDLCSLERVVEAAVERAVERALATLIGGDRTRPPAREYMAAEQIAAERGVTRGWVYAHKRELGGEPLGEGPRPRWRFPRVRVEARFAELADRRAAGDAAARPSPLVVYSPRRATARTDLLPVRPRSR